MWPYRINHREHLNASARVREFLAFCSGMTLRSRGNYGNATISKAESTDYGEQIIRYASSHYTLDQLILYYNNKDFLQKARSSSTREALPGSSTA